MLHEHKRLLLYSVNRCEEKFWVGIEITHLEVSRSNVSEKISNRFLYVYLNRSIVRLTTVRFVCSTGIRLMN